MTDPELSTDHAIIDMHEGGGARPRPSSPSSVRAMAEQLALQLLAFAAAIEVDGYSQAPTIPASAAGETAHSPVAVDLVEYWIGIPEEQWRSDAIEVDPPDGKLWLTPKQTEGLVGRGTTFVRSLIRDYPIALMYGRTWSVNRYRAIAAMRGRLPSKKAGN